MPASVASSFGEAQDFEAALRPEGCAGVLVTGRGAFRARLVQLALHRLRLLACEEALGRVAFFIVPAGMVLVVFAVPGASSPIWGGIEPIAREIMTISPGERLHARTDGPCGWGAMLLPEDALLAYASALTGVAFIVPRGIARWRPAPKAWRNLRDLYRAAIRAGQRQPASVADDQGAHGLEQQLIHALIECLPSTAMSKEPPPSRRHRDLLARFEDFLVTGPSGSLSEICGALGTSERLLRLCFKLHLGMSPTDYRRRRAMQQVNRQLLYGNSQEMSVAEVAKRHGFNALGRFANNYRALYGELPSATLRNSRGIAMRR
jgi:AraC-like DNA-binding protein